MKQQHDGSNDTAPESKTRRKKDMIAVQKLGEELTTLSRKQLNALELPETLQAALREMDRIPNSNEARRRHLQFIGRVMRDCDYQSIQQQLDQLRTPDISQVRRAQSIEYWGEHLLGEGRGEGVERDESKGEGEEAVSRFLDAYPTAERQALRQIQRNYTNAVNRDENEARVQRRKLLDYIKPFIN